MLRASISIVSAAALAGCSVNPPPPADAGELVSLQEAKLSLLVDIDFSDGTPGRGLDVRLKRAAGASLDIGQTDDDGRRASPISEHDTTRMIDDLEVVGPDNHLLMIQRVVLKRPTADTLDVRVQVARPTAVAAVLWSAASPAPPATDEIDLQVRKWLEASDGGRLLSLPKSGRGALSLAGELAYAEAVKSSLHRLLIEKSLEESPGTLAPRISCSYGGLKKREYRTRRFLIRYTTDPNARESRVAIKLPTGVTHVPRWNSKESIECGEYCEISDRHTDAGGVVPATVQRIGAVAEDAFAKFAADGVRVPAEGKLIEIELCAPGHVLRGGLRHPDAGRSYGISCVGCPIVLDRGLDSESNPGNLLQTVPHEVFHQLQYLYLPDQSMKERELRPLIVEGGARLAEGLVDPGPRMYAFSGKPFFRREPPSLVEEDTAYGGGLLWRYGVDRGEGLSTYLELLICAQRFGYGMDAVRHWQGDLKCSGSVSEDAFVGDFFSTLRLQAGGSAPGRARNFTFAEGDAPIGIDPGATLTQYSREGFSGSETEREDVALTRGGAYRVTHNHWSNTRLPRWSARFHLIRPDPLAGPRRVRITVTAGMTGDSLPMFRVLRLGPELELLSSQSEIGVEGDWTIPLSGTEEVTVVAIARDNAIDYELKATEVE